MRKIKHRLSIMDMDRCMSLALAGIVLKGEGVYLAPEFVLSKCAVLEGEPLLIEILNFLFLVTFA